MQPLTDRRDFGDLSTSTSEEPRITPWPWLAITALLLGYVLRTVVLNVSPGLLPFSDISPEPSRVDSRLPGRK